MDWYLVIKTIHILSSTVLFGTGMGIAFFMFCSYFAEDIYQRFYAARFTVLADYIFTLPAVIIQPISGYWLITAGGYEFFDLWLTVTYVLYILAGICWLPVVWIQIQLKEMLMQAIKDDAELPERYGKLFRIWFLLGWPAFIGLVGIFFLMVFKPL